jgi:tripartite-type tricarboxylate transporter receptor subunit TctC
MAHGRGDCAPRVLVLAIFSSRRRSAVGVVLRAEGSRAGRCLVAHAERAGGADIPTLKALGYQEELFGVWFSYLTPAGIPEDARKALVGVIEQTVKAPAVATKLAPLGILQT